MKKLSWIVLLLALASNAFALSGDAPVASKTQDGSGNAITSTGAALDVNLKTASVGLGRTWSLLNSTDSVNAVQSGTWTLGAGSALIGKVGIDQTTPGTTNKVSIGTDGVVAIGTGSAVIGHVIADTGSTTAVTQATGSNLHAVIDSGSTTAVTQATGTNLHVVVDSGSVTTSASAVSTRSDTFTVAANGTTVNASTTGVKYFSIACKGTGAAPTAWNIVLEGSNDNTNFTTILTHTNASLSDGQTLYSGTTATPALYFRSRLVTVTLGSATNIVCVILGM